MMKRFSLYLTCALVAVVSVVLVIPCQSQGGNFKKE